MSKTARMLTETVGSRQLLEVVSKHAMVVCIGFILLHLALKLVSVEFEAFGLVFPTLSFAFYSFDQSIQIKLLLKVGRLGPRI